MPTTSYTLTCLSPVHVGTGNQFGKFDAVYDAGTWYLIDLDRVLARGVPANQLADAMQRSDFNWKGWLQGQLIPSAEVASYQLAAGKDPAETVVREAMKDTTGNPYLPGSSLKGAVRTTVLWYLLNHSPHHKDHLLRYLSSDRGLNSKRESVAQEIERKVLGDNPNHDLLRAVRVGDSQPTALHQLALGLAWTYSLKNNRLIEKVERKQGRGQEYKSYLEWLRPETTLTISMSVDSFLFSNQAEEELRFQGAKQEAIFQLAHTCNDYAENVAGSELNFYEKYGPEELTYFYAALQEMLMKMPRGAFLLNVGWGGGWETKTVADLLRKPLGEKWKDLRRQFRLGRDPSAPFPKTRRIAYDHSGPRWPLGWVILSPTQEKVILPPIRRTIRSPAKPTPVGALGTAVAKGPSKPVNKGQTRTGILKRQGSRWAALFEGDMREATITNPNKLPTDLQEGQKAEFYIEEASKKIGIRVRFDKIL